MSCPQGDLRRRVDTQRWACRLPGWGGDTSRADKDAGKEVGRCPRFSSQRILRHFMSEQKPVAYLWQGALALAAAVVLDGTAHRGLPHSRPGRPPSWCGVRRRRVSRSGARRQHWSILHLPISRTLRTLLAAGLELVGTLEQVNRGEERVPTAMSYRRCPGYSDSDQ